MAKKITLPIGNKIIFDYMAEAYMASGKAKKANVQELSDEMAREAFLHSFTPSGEVGSGDNPRMKKKDNFFDHFDDLFCPDSGIIAQSMPDSGKAKIKQAIKNVKSVVVELIKVYSSFAHPSMTVKDKKRFNLYVAIIVTNTVRDLLQISDEEILNEISSRALSRLSDSDFIEKLK